MSKTLWEVTSHTIPASHPRGFSRAVRDEVNDRLRLAVKEYRPKGRDVRAGGATLIVAHGVGGCKEHFEPFFDDIVAEELPIGAIWSFDSVHHAESYLLNEEVIGDQHHWDDNARDLLQIINYFQAQMLPPIYGIGLSWGVSALWIASSWHPSLFAGIVAVEGPSFTTARNFQKHPGDEPRKDAQHKGVLISKRRETWPSRQEARQRFLANPFFRAYDPRAIDVHMKYCLRNTPTPENPHAVTLTTPKSMEAAVFFTPDPPLVGYPKQAGSGTYICVNGFYKPEVEDIVTATPHIRQPILFILGTESEIGTSTVIAELVEMTGSGNKGNGGTRTGQVQRHLVDDSGHAVLLEKPKESAVLIGRWLRKLMKRWYDEKDQRRGTARFEPAVLKKEWTDRISKL